MSLHAHVLANYTDDDLLEQGGYVVFQNCPMMETS